MFAKRLIFFILLQKRIRHHFWETWAKLHQMASPMYKLFHHHNAYHPSRMQFAASTVYVASPVQSLRHTRVGAMTWSYRYIPVSIIDFGWYSSSWLVSYSESWKDSRTKSYWYPYLISGHGDSFFSSCREPNARLGYHVKFGVVHKQPIVRSEDIIYIYIYIYKLYIV